MEISMYSRTSSFLASLSERTHRNKLAFSFLFLVWTTSRVLQRNRYSDHKDHQLFSRFLHPFNRSSKYIFETTSRILSRRLSRSIACTTLLVSKSVVISRSAHSIRVVCYVGETLLHFGNIHQCTFANIKLWTVVRIILTVSLHRPGLYFHPGYKWMVFVGIKIYTNVFFQIVIEYNGKLNAWRFRINLLWKISDGKTVEARENSLIVVFRI